MTSTVTRPESPQPDAPDDTVPSDGNEVPRSRHSRLLVGIGVAVVVMIAALGITGVTGLAGPGPIQRYPYGDLHQLANLVNAQAGPMRTPDDCWRALHSAQGPLRAIAKVDYVRSRVVVRLYARQLGQVDYSVRNLSEREIQKVLDAHPELSRDMIVTEPSPDGWSPNLTCRVGNGSRIAGF